MKVRGAKDVVMRHATGVFVSPCLRRWFDLGRRGSRTSAGGHPLWLHTLINECREGDSHMKACTNEDGEIQALGKCDRGSGDRAAAPCGAARPQGAASLDERRALPLPLTTPPLPHRPPPPS